MLGYYRFFESIKKYISLRFFRFSPFSTKIQKQRVFFIGRLMTHGPYPKVLNIPLGARLHCAIRYLGPWAMGLTALHTNTYRT